MADDFQNHAIGLTSPAQGVFNPSLHDTTAQAHVSRSIRADVAGSIKITGLDGNACVCKFNAGEERAIRATHLWSNGTTISASDIEVMY